MKVYTYLVGAMQALVLSVLLFSPLRAQTLLVMFEAEGCPYCEQWLEEIGPIYPKTAEGRRAPLLRTDIYDPVPEGITVEGELIYTPTFVLVNDGKEVARLVGYPGEDFFWGMLDRMLKELPEQNTEGSS